MRLTFTSCLFLLLLTNLQHSNSLNFGGRDLLNSAKDLATGTLSKIPDVLPSPESLFQSGKNILAGYPFEFVSTAINSICSAAVSNAAIKPHISPEFEKMSFLLMTPEQNYSYPLLQANELMESKGFDNDKKLVILITGWTTDLNDTNGAIYTISQAYFCRGDTNFVVVDTAKFVDTLYTWSALNTEELGQNIAKGLIVLVKHVQLEKIHLIGHSLGAHIAGSAGRSFYYQTKTLIPRITGLDPAKPCFNEGETLSGLQRGDADFIDVIHSNPGVLGRRDPIGDVDFYPGGLVPLPPGCTTVTCAHARAWEYYAESVYPGNENNFMATKCSSLGRLQANKCPGGSHVMGYNVSKELKGNYFLDINSKKPFGKNAKNQEIVDCKY